MFRKLRNKLIIINLGITSLVILAVFSAIYIISTSSASNRPPMPNEKRNEFSEEIENFVEKSVREERESAAKQLLIILVVSGVTIELIVVFISYFLAEEAIKPVREAYESQKVFIANASHEIKTPLAAITANLEAADIRGNKWISNVEKETAKLTMLNNELLTLARTDLVNTINLEEVELGEVVKRELEAFEPRMEEIEFSKNIDVTDVIKINVSDFVQILNILLDNAIKYCEKRIDLILGDRKLIIENDGTTISDKDLTRIFDRFYQADKSADGVGLGLSIAKGLAKHNGWRLLAKSDNNKTKFILRF